MSLTKRRRVQDYHRCVYKCTLYQLNDDKMKYMILSDAYRCGIADGRTVKDVFNDMQTRMEGYIKDSLSLERRHIYPQPAPLPNEVISCWRDGEFVKELYAENIIHGDGIQTTFQVFPQGYNRINYFWTEV